MKRHPTTATWAFPPAERAPLAVPRANLRELCARPERFEHHLVVVGRVGDGQIEIVTASEPLYFAHANVSDELALALPTGDALIDGFPFLTFLSDPDSHTDVGRIRSRAGQLVLHPHGLLHWTGRLRPPFELPPFPGARRTGLSLVFCSATPIAPTERVIHVSDGLAADVKAYTAARDVPLSLTDVLREPPRLLARVGNARMELLVKPAVIGGASGGYLIVLEGSAPWFATDIAFFAAGVTHPGDGVARALWISADVHASPPSDAWREVALAPFACFEDDARASLPLEIHGVRVEAADASAVSVSIAHGRAEVPRHWLTRMLFRLALHGYRLGYLETYGGFYYDDRRGFRLGLRGADSVALTREQMAEVVETVYRAVAPEGYVERVA